MSSRSKQQSGRKQKILRIGLFQNGKFIEERLIHSRKSVTIGQDFKKNTFVVPVSNLPASLSVFEVREGKYYLNFDKNVAGQLSTGDGGSPKLADLVRTKRAKKSPKGSGYTVALDDKMYGRIAFGSGADEVALLFQFVTPPPPRPKPVLPASMRGGIVAGIVGSMILAVTCGISAVLQIGFLAFVLSRDWPKPRDMKYEMPDRFVKVMVDKKKDIEVSDEKMEVESEGKSDEEAPSEQPEEKPQKTQEKPKQEKKEMTPEERAAAEAERKRRLAEEVKNKTILSQLGSLSSDGGTIVDTLSQGSGKTSMDEAFANSQGVKAGVAGAEKSGLRTSGSSDADGKGSSVGIGDLKGTKGARAAKHGVDTGHKTEKKVKVRVNLKTPEKVIGTGKLDSASISSVIRRRQSQIQRCYERYIKKNPKASGKVVASFTIGTAGRVTKSRAVQDSVGGSVGRCVAGVIRRFHFPRPKGGEVMVNKTFVFEVAQ